MTTASETVRNLVLLVLLAAMWSSAFAFIKIGVATVPPLSLAAGRIVVAAVILYVYLRARGEALPRSRRLWALFFWIGLFGNGLPFALIGWGEVRIPSALAAILMAVMPLATMVLAHLFTADERLTVRKLVGLGVGFAGVVVLVGPEALRGLGGDVLRQLAVAGGAICYGIAAVMARRLGPLSIAAQAAGVMVVAAAQMVPLALVVEPPWAMEASLASVGAVVYLGVVPTAVAAILFFHLLAKRGASFVALNNYLIPPLGVAWGWLFLSESVTSSALGALALVLAGIAIANPRLRRVRPEDITKP